MTAPTAKLAVEFHLLTRWVMAAAGIIWKNMESVLCRRRCSTFGGWNSKSKFGNALRFAKIAR